MPSARQAAGCAEGWEPSIQSSHCTIPEEVHIALGCLYWIVVPFTVLSETAVHAPSFFEYDLEKKCIVVIRSLSLTCFFMNIEKLAYDRDWSDSGWAWALALHAELARHDAPWAAALEPLARDFAARFHAFLPRLTYPLRVGTHFNIAFALILARDWAQGRDDALAALIHDRALHWFAQDRACQAWEPGGDEFLSPALCEALLMSRLIDRTDFAAWFHAFLPDLGSGEPATLFTPATVSDRSDGKIAHLDGLNLSRAWCWRGIAAALGESDPVHTLAHHAARVHLDASLPHVAGDYMGEHWLATFALLALDRGRDSATWQALERLLITDPAKLKQFVKEFAAATQA